MQKRDEAKQAYLFWLFKKRQEINESFNPVLNLTKQVATAKEQKVLPLSESSDTYKVYATQIVALDPSDKKLKTYSGPNITAKNSADAQRLINNTGLGYCEIIGQLLGLIDLNGKDVKEAYRLN